MALFKKATKTQSKLRMALYGVSGSGKTYSALSIATGLGGRIALIDTERGSASKYAGRFTFDVLEMQPPFTPASYVQAIKAAEAEGYDVLVIDSLTHAWSGAGGALEMVDNAAARSSSKNSYTAWRDVTPQHNALVDAILQVRCHVIATMRSKTDYVQERDERSGKMMPRKIGLAPVQRDGMEYEFDVMGEMDMGNNLIVQKTRCEELSGKVFSRPNGLVSDILRAWLSDGAPKTEPVTQPTIQQERNRSAMGGNGDLKSGVPFAEKEAAAKLGGTIRTEQKTTITQDEARQALKPILDTQAYIWRDDITTKAKLAGALVANADTGLAADISAAQSFAREVWTKNGVATKDEIDKALKGLQSVIDRAEAIADKAAMPA